MHTAKINSVSDIAVEWFCTEPKHSGKFRWSEVDRIDAFKRDLFSADLICIVIHAGTDEIEFDEDDPGWERFLEQLPLGLPGCPPYLEWFSSVAFPPMESNFRILYQRH